MNIDRVRVLAVVIVVGAVAVFVYYKKTTPEPMQPAGVAAQAGAALDKAAEKTKEVATNVAAKTTEAAKATAAATKDVAKEALENTGKALEKAGAAVEQAGEKIQP